MRSLIVRSYRRRCPQVACTVRWAPAFSAYQIRHSSRHGRNLLGIFLIYLADNDVILGSLLVFGLYAHHCFIRHENIHISPKESIYRLVSGAALCGKASQVWWEYMKSIEWRPAQARHDGTGWTRWEESAGWEEHLYSYVDIHICNTPHMRII